MRLSGKVLVVAALVFSASCGAQEELEITEEPRLQPPEVFIWSDRPIEFAPPPAEWTRHRQQGAAEGIRFQIARVPPGRIAIGDYRLLHRGHTRRSAVSGVEKRFEPPQPGFTLDDVVDRVRFDPRDMPRSETVTVEPDLERTVGGQRAVALDYTWNDGRTTLHGREVYLLADGHLFVATVLGTEADLALFERVVETIRFPPIEDGP